MTKQTFWSRLKEGLKKSSSKLSDNIKTLFQGRLFSKELLEELEEVLIMSDLGVRGAAELIDALKKHTFESKPTEYDVRVFLAKELSKKLEPFAKDFMPDEQTSPYVYLFFGVNGAGKTTSIAKMAHQLLNQGKTVGIAACDTFRAAATEQLEKWATRLNVPFFQGTSSDSASVAFEALQKASDKKLETLFIDTAGRLPNKPQLLDELKKIIRVLQKL
ncbi:MAG TPA: signal recognition particle receptor subunit alpha, partial [Alphaproteobacteria bacterium]|nr:signal recognition particle receptor subunit alpha [Alphaproteobacteria bacterium]